MEAVVWVAAEGVARGTSFPTLSDNKRGREHSEGTCTLPADSEMTSRALLLLLLVASLLLLQSSAAPFFPIDDAPELAPYYVREWARAYRVKRDWSDPVAQATGWPFMG